MIDEFRNFETISLAEYDEDKEELVLTLINNKTYKYLIGRKLWLVFKNYPDKSRIFYNFIKSNGVEIKDRHLSLKDGIDENEKSEEQSRNNSSS